MCRMFCSDLLSLLLFLNSVKLHTVNLAQSLTSLIRTSSFSLLSSSSSIDLLPNGTSFSFLRFGLNALMSELFAMVDHNLTSLDNLRAFVVMMTVDDAVRRRENYQYIYY